MTAEESAEYYRLTSDEATSLAHMKWKMDNVEATRNLNSLEAFRVF